MFFSWKQKDHSDCESNLALWWGRKLTKALCCSFFLSTFEEIGADSCMSVAEKKITSCKKGCKGILKKNNKKNQTQPRKEGSISI